MANEVAVTENKEMGLMMGNNISMFLDTSRFEFAQRVASMFAQSSMVPDHFKKNVGNCMIALNLADRMRVDPFMLMQNLYVVHGRPGIEAKLAIALINGAGRFTPLEFAFEEHEEEGKRCRAFATEIKTGKTLYGPWVSWQMAKAERWVDKDGSKWKTMPDLMFMYRSAMFFARVYDPGVLLGLRTKDELDDMVIDVTPVESRTLKPDGEAPDPGADPYKVQELPPEKPEQPKDEIPEMPADLDPPDPDQAKGKPSRGRPAGSKNKKPAGEPLKPEDDEPPHPAEVETDKPDEATKEFLKSCSEYAGALEGSNEYERTILAFNTNNYKVEKAEDVPKEMRSAFLRTLRSRLDKWIADK